MRRVFVDTGGFFALRTPDDRCHERAKELFESANAEGWVLVTTNAVVVEAYSLFLNRLRDGRREAIALLDMISADRYRVERVRVGDETQAITLVRAREDKTYSLCDALSFVVMERLRIKEAIAFDRHFRAYGRFTVL